MPKPVGWVNDFEGLFTREEERVLDSLIRAFEKETTIQIALVTLPGTITTAAGLDSFTLALARYWGVGQKEKDNGILIGFSREHGRIRIQNGTGIERVLTDAATKEIIDTVFIPHFRQRRYYEGSLEGLRALMQRLR